MGSSIPSNWQSGVYKRDKRNPHFLFPSRIAQQQPRQKPRLRVAAARAATLIDRSRYGMATKNELNGLSIGARCTLLNPASLHSSRTFDSGNPTVPRPSPWSCREVVMQ
jgi:hypothetical protein